MLKATGPRASGRWRPRELLNVREVLRVGGVTGIPGFFCSLRAGNVDWEVLGEKLSLTELCVLIVLLNFLFSIFSIKFSSY